MAWESRYDNTCVCSMDKRGVQSGERKRALAGVLIVVEGVNDMRRIRAFLDVDVYVLGSATRAGDSDLIGELQHLGTVYKRIILLLDPDVAGRQARNEIDRRVDGCWHAFIPVASAQSRVNKKFKDIGDVGVEHASSAAIQAAIRRSRKSRRENVFSREYLISHGVVAPMHQRGDNVTWRRELLCEYLGLGMCDGKQLLRQLNSYGFLPEDVEKGLQYANKIINSDMS
ncbi:hypothetical protein M9434_000228 [Picochlorum sp. BPE23]|nr:hypothetical protein M9434_000228 [Picochlorum sp. BPE23]